MNIKQTISRSLVNARGWRTNRKIIVIESDDWGSIRMPSREVYEKCLKNGYAVDRNPYERFDSIASETDLIKLFDLLVSFKDKSGNHPTITANCVTANPDFNKIKQDSFKKYYFELITDTFKRYPEHKANFALWKKGLQEGVFFPQFHAREHLNVSLFMRMLQQRDTDVLWAFQNEMPGSIQKANPQKGNAFVKASYYDSEADKQEKLTYYLEGLDLFESLFGYKSETITPPNYIWSNDFNNSVQKKRVKYIQGIHKMFEPVPGKRTRHHFRVLGAINHFNQICLVRNCVFEPTLNPTINFVNRCLLDIAVAFRLNKPAVISSHRINYVGFIDHHNRDRNLKLLELLLTKIMKNWPNVEFMNSLQLGDLIRTTKNLP